MPWNENYVVDQKREFILESLLLIPEKGYTLKKRKTRKVLPML
jgi:hypothetical protein